MSRPSVWVCVLLIGASVFAFAPSFAPAVAQGAPAISISPASGPTNTVVTISGAGLTAGHTYQYCVVPGPPPATPTPCPYGAYTFTAASDGTVPALPAITVTIVGYPESYTVIVSDPTGSLILTAVFSMTGGPSSTTHSNTATSTTTSSSSSGGGVPEFPLEIPAVILTALVLAAAYLFARRGTLLPNRA